MKKQKPETKTWEEMSKSEKAYGLVGLAILGLIVWGGFILVSNLLDKKDPLPAESPEQNNSINTNQDKVENQKNKEKIRLDKEARVNELLVEAEITCQQYAETYLRVENINIGYNQSSIRRINKDGSILIKAKIADSQGVFRQQKPLGIMECTTSKDGLDVSAFEVY